MTIATQPDVCLIHGEVKMLVFTIETENGKQQQTCCPKCLDEFEVTG